MTKLELLQLLRGLIEDSPHPIYKNDDPSGCRTEYVVDQSKLLGLIDDLIDSELSKTENWRLW